VCERAVAGVPSILVPLPIGNGEQKLNARELVAAGGALLVEDANFTPDYVRQSVLPLLSDATRLQEMARAAAGQGRRDAAEVMARMVIEEIEAGAAGQDTTGTAGGQNTEEG